MYIPILFDIIIGIGFDKKSLSKATIAIVKNDIYTNFT